MDRHDADRRKLSLLFFPVYRENCFPVYRGFICRDFVDIYYCVCIYLLLLVSFADLISENKLKPGHLLTRAFIANKFPLAWISTNFDLYIRPRLSPVGIIGELSRTPPNSLQHHGMYGTEGYKRSLY